MRYLAVGLVALLISAPAAALAGPDAISIAKRALALAKQPPQVKQIYTATPAVTDPQYDLFRVRCPRGMVAVSITPETPAVYETVNGRRAWATLPRNQWGSGGASGITVTCMEGQLTR